MQIDQLQVQDFRSYQSLRAEFSHGITQITGQNGQGKTNLAEALYLAAVGRSFRTHKDKEMIRFGQNLTSVRSFTRTRLHRYDLKISISQNRRKSILINQVPASTLSELLGLINIVVFSPGDLLIITGGPSERRGFLDREISQLRPFYYNALYAYHQTLLQRNNLLKTEHPDKALLDVYDLQLAQSARRIQKERADFIERIRPFSENTHKTISGGRENLLLRYEPNIDPKYDILDKLSQTRTHDLFRKTTTCGPHRDDLGLFIGSMDLRTYGSQGQKRSAAISLKLSEIDLIYQERKEHPVVILDDIFSELDLQRQRLLMQTLGVMQVFLTATEPLDLPGSRVLQISENQLLEL